MSTISVPEISDLDVAFGTVKGLPDYGEIPNQFKSHNGTPWNGLVSKLFFAGVSNLSLSPADGVDPGKAARHIKALLGSFEPKHEHKEAGVAYLMSRYFTAAKWDGGSISASS